MRSIIVIVVVVAAAVARAELRFLTGPLVNQSVLATAMTKDLGPQVGTSRAPTLGILYAFTGNPCSVDAIPVEVADKIVLITQLALCAPFVQYDAFSARGAAGLVRMLFTIPGRNHYGVSMFDRRLGVRDNSMIFLEIRLNRTLVATALKVRNMTVSASPDANPWVAMYDSFVYQWLGRWPTALIYAYTTVLAYAYLYVHLGLILTRIRRGNSAAASWPVPAKVVAVLRALGPTHIALLIKAMVSPTMLVVTVLGGYFSSGQITHEAQLFFLRRLDGWDHAAVVLAALFYYQTLSQSRLVATALSVNVIAALICMFSVALDTAAALAYAMFSESVYPDLNLIWAAYGTAFTLLTALFFIGNAVLFWVRVRTNRVASGQNDAALAAFLSRVGWFGTGIGVCLLIQGVIYLTLSIVLVSVIVYTPTIFCWQTIATNLVVAVKGFFIVRLLTPRRQHGDASKRESGVLALILPLGWSRSSRADAYTPASRGSKPQRQASVPAMPQDSAGTTPCL